MKKLLEDAQKADTSEKKQKIIAVINEMKKNNGIAHQFFLDVMREHRK